MNHFIIIDTETTGLSPKNAEITEIAAIKVDRSTFEVIDTYTTLVDIEGDVPYFISNLTGITKQMLVKHGIPMKQALTDLASFCEECEIYAHNAAFDKNFIRTFLYKENVPFVETNWVDTISIFKKALPGRSTYKLESLILDFNLASKEDHRALSDAMHTLELLKKVK